MARRDRIRLRARRERIIDELTRAQAHARLDSWSEDATARDAIAFRLILAAKLARDVERPADVPTDVWTWLRDVVRFGSVHEPDPAEFRRVVEAELPGVRARLAATLED